MIEPELLKHRMSKFEESINMLMQQNRDTWTQYILQIPTWIRDLYEERNIIMDMIRQMKLPDLNELVDLLNQAIKNVEQHFLNVYSQAKK